MTEGVFLLSELNSNRPNSFQNYLVVVEPDGVTKYGLVEGKHGHERLPLPPSSSSGHITQLSATPRHLLAVTTEGGSIPCSDSK